MTIQQAYKQLLVQLFDLYDNREAANISDLVIEHVTGQRKIDRIMYKDLPVTPAQELELENISRQLVIHTPIQYVLHEAWFAGMKLYVDENVLIPRPETEELVEWILEDQAAEKTASASILDVGTGSGCIALALACKLPLATVHATDVSGEAIRVAARNAAAQNTPVTFSQLDFLDPLSWSTLPTFNLVVSNPPYIRQSEEVNMANNVLLYEPHTALFVPDDNALVFYSTLVQFCQHHLSAGGWLYVEINETLGEQVKATFSAAGITGVEIKKDMQGKDRMVKGRKD